MSSSAFAVYFGAKLFQAKTLLVAVNQPSTSSVYLACGVRNIVTVVIKGTNLIPH